MDVPRVFFDCFGTPDIIGALPLPKFVQKNRAKTRKGVCFIIYSLRKLLTGLTKAAFTA